MSLVSNILLKRAEMLSRARSFFAGRGIFEVDTFHLSQSAPIDSHIDLLSADLPDNSRRFLLSSPEFPMKKLLSKNSPDIYQLAHVFRSDFKSPRHIPEFMMAEWYRKKITFSEMIEETCTFCELFTGNREREMISYREAFLRYLDIDPFTAHDRDLLEKIPSEITCPLERDDILNLLVSTLIEPKFDPKKLTCLYNYPRTQAALAQLNEEAGHPVAERFEIYTAGLELANGYHETQSSDDLLERFIAINKQRITLKKTPYPIDQAFLDANKNLPDCCGVAVGFDRLMMVHLKTNQIDETYPLPWHQS